jgi:hypothetical protein
MLKEIKLPLQNSQFSAISGKPGINQAELPETQWAIAWSWYGNLSLSPMDWVNYPE